MIKFQSEYEVRELNVVRDTFNNKEKRKVRWTRYFTYGNIVWHLVKIGIPISTLISCVNYGLVDAECDKITNKRIALLLYVDCIESTLLLLYTILAMGQLIFYSWRYSRLEARAHMRYFIGNSVGLLLSWPLVINGLFTFLKYEDEVSYVRWVHYQNLLGKLIPCLAYIATKSTEDCFNCFNRLAPQNYSIVTYSHRDVLNNTSSDRLEVLLSYSQSSMAFKSNKSSSSRFLISHCNNLNETELLYIKYPCIHGK